MGATLRVRFGRLSLPVAALAALLQRSPVLRVAERVGSWAGPPSATALLKFGGAAIAGLGALDSIAGATYLATSLTPDPPNGVLPTFQADVGVEITPLAFTIEPLITIGSWKIGGVLPPGLTLTTKQPNGGSLMDHGGLLDATTATNTLTTPVLEGTPTVPGTYVVNFQGFWYGGESGGPTGKGVSAIYPFTIVVSGTAPVFTLQPTSVSVTGGTAVLNAVANFVSSYQWLRNGAPVPGATTSILQIADAAAATGSYTCLATNPEGSTTSSPATVSVVSTNNVGRLVNISTRSEVGTGSGIQIAGFVIGGQGVSGKESLLVRASGPALAALGVQDVLPDPQLQLFNAGTLLSGNNGWQGDVRVASAASAVNAFAWSDPTSHDSALLFSGGPGAFTAQVSGAANDTGIALVELYDLTPAGTYNPSMPRLTNISARVHVGIGGNILIAGFVVGGVTARTVLVRASGPALDAFGVEYTLPDPMLTLFSGSTVIASNYRWGGNPQIASVAASVGAFPWSDPTSEDSALLLTLPPGAYTAQIQGAGGDTGVALVEVYDVP